MVQGSRRAACLNRHPTPRRDGSEPVHRWVVVVERCYCRARCRGKQGRDDFRLKISCWFADSHHIGTSYGMPSFFRRTGSAAVVFTKKANNPAMASPNVKIAIFKSCIERNRHDERDEKQCRGNRTLTPITTTHAITARTALASNAYDVSRRPLSFTKLACAAGSPAAGKTLQPVRSSLQLFARSDRSSTWHREIRNRLPPVGRKATQQHA